jgi:hypothetical protein
MERDLILGYMSIKLTSFLAMYLHGRDEPAGPGLLALCVAGTVAGLLLLARSWRKAGALADAPVTTADEPVPPPVIAREASPAAVGSRRPEPATTREPEPA